MKRVIEKLHGVAGLRREERVIAGRVGGAVWMIGALTIVALALVLPAARRHETALLALGGAGLLWGLVSVVLIDYTRVSRWLFHASTIAGAGSIAAAIALSGGARSPAWACLFYVVVYAAFFLRPTAAAAYFAACVAIQALTVLELAPGARAEGLAALAVSAPAFIVLGGAIVLGRRYMWSLRLQAERLAAAQGALRRVATAAVRGEDERFYEVVAQEAGRLLDAGSAAILRLDAPREMTIVGAWNRDGAPTYPCGAKFPVVPGSDTDRALSLGRPVRGAELGLVTSGGPVGHRSRVVAPINVAGKTWGVLAAAVAVAEPRRDGLSSEHERRLTEFGDLIAAAVTSIEDRAELQARAATDPLTGLANHRTFREQLSSDLARHRRHESPVSIAVIDVDRFKQVNDCGGHEAGDEMLVRVARCLAAHAREEDTLARVGGDEFAWILPETPGEQALAAVERARQAIARVGVAGQRITVSAGICDSGATDDPAELIRLADRALYRSKHGGRDQAWLYELELAEEVAAPAS
jgi:diguanylate cyclase (GGDEF)-like protein